MITDFHGKSPNGLLYRCDSLEEMNHEMRKLRAPTAIEQVEMYFNVNYLSSLFKSICYVTSAASAGPSAQSPITKFYFFNDLHSIFDRNICREIFLQQRIAQHSSAFVATSSHLIEGKIHRDSSWQQKASGCTPSGQIYLFLLIHFVRISALLSTVYFAPIPSNLIPVAAGMCNRIALTVIVNPVRSDCA